MRRSADDTSSSSRKGAPREGRGLRRDRSDRPRAFALLAGEHEIVAVSRTPREPEDGVPWVSRRRLGSGRRARSPAPTSPTTSSTRSASATSSSATRGPRGKTLHESARAGVRQIVYLGGLGGDDADDPPTCAAGARRGASRADGVPVTTLRAAIVVGKGAPHSRRSSACVKRLPLMITPSWVSTPTQPIALADIARYLAGVEQQGRLPPELRRRRPGGDDIPPMIERIAAAIGRKPRIVEVPVLTPALSALWLELVHP